MQTAKKLIKKFQGPKYLKDVFKQKKINHYMYDVPPVLLKYKSAYNS